MIGQTLAHYKILEKIGSGGMGDVYLAKDTKLDRKVALKVLPPELAESEERRARFKREAKAIAALDHPNIVQVFSVEDAEGTHFITMQLVRGKTLTELLPKNGFPLSEFFDIAIQLADAVAAAHQEGITHRDLKPDNMMLGDDGRIRVLDFGLAKFAEPSSHAGTDVDSDLATEARTKEGVIVGTAPYMSPEQVSGRAVDSRSDIFSLGIVLFEMAAGRRPFTGGSAIELLWAILKDEPRSLSELKPELPDSLSRIVRRCLAKNPEERYQDAGELHRELSGVAGGSNLEEKAAPAEAPWIAVLPLKTRSGDAELDAFADGLSEDITTGLSRFSHLFVVSASSASRYKGRAVDVREVGKELGARFVIEGSIRKAGPRVRVNVQLLDATSGTHLWAEHFDRDISGGDVFAAQDELTDRIVATVADTYGVLSRSLAALVKEKPVEELTAYESVLRMFGYWQQVTPHAHAEVRTALERSLEREPNHADAWGCVSWAYVIEHKLGFNPRPDPLDRALSAARRGVELDATSQIAYSALAHAHYCRRELGAFRAAAERVLTLNPRETFHVALMGLLIATAGDWARGTSVMRETLALNPHHAGWCHLVFVWDHYRKHEYDKAVEAAELINMPGLYKAPAVLAAANAQLGRTEAAKKHVEDLLELVPDYGKWARDDWTKEFVSEELVEHMLEGLEKAGLEIAEAAPAPSHPRQPFVGRSTEQQKLFARLDAVSRGEGALVLIGGEPGVGKTRLASEILEEGKSRGLLTLTGHAYEEEGAPFISIVEILEEMVRVVSPRDLRRLLGEAGSEIARLVPELRRRFTDIPEPLELPPEQQRRYLFNAVLELFERTSRETPIVLLMDDLHWADESSLLLLEHLASHLEKLPLLILGTYRDVELDVQKPFEKTLARLVRQKLAERYAIRRLAEPDVRDLLAALGGSDPPVVLVSAIYRETEGNPFFVTEVFQHLSEEGALFDDGGEWKSELDVEALDVPEGVRLVIGRRLERLGEQTPKVLALAAVFGRRFEVRVLEAVEGQDPDAVLDALDEAIAAGLVTSITVGREARYEFAHELIRQTLLATLSLPRRQRLHLRVANAFEKVYEARADERAAEVARHLYQAGTAAESTKTIHYLRKAAERALAAAASDEALRFLNMSLSLLEDEPGDGSEKADLLSLRGLAHRGLGRLQDTEADLRAALVLYEEAQRWDELARIASDLIYLLMYAGRSSDAMQIAERGLERAGAESSARCRLLSGLGLAVTTGGDMRRARETFEEAVSLARRLENPRLLGETLRSALYYYFDVFGSDDLVRAGEEAIVLHRELGASWALSNSMAMTRLGWLVSGQFDKIDGSADELLTLSTRQGDLGSQMLFSMVQAPREAARGDLDAYEVFTQRSVDLALTSDWPWSPWNLGSNAFAHVFRGRAEDAKQLFDRAEPERLRGTVWDGTYDGLKLLACAYLEDPEAMAVFEASRERLPKLGEENPGGLAVVADDGHRGVDAARPARASGGALSAHKGARRKRCDGAAGSRRAAHRKVRGYRCDGR